MFRALGMYYKYRTDSAQHLITARDDLDCISVDDISVDDISVDLSVDISLRMICLQMISL